MVVFMGRNLNDDQIYFNKRLQSTRNVIERTIGVLKMRWRCLNSERKLHYHPTRAGKIIYACATLHNFLMLNGFRRDVENFDIQNIINVQNQDRINQIANNNNAAQLRVELMELLELQRVRFD